MNRRSLILLALPVLLGLAVACNGAKSPRTVEDFNFGWRFRLGDSEDFASPSYEDSGWRELHLPHDWSIEGEFSEDNPSTPGGGALPGGIGWYRKFFDTPEGGRCYLEFDGVFMNSTVYVNGIALGTRPYGYSSFSYDITDALNPDGPNLIAVRCDNSDQPNSRWYAGCGIYRNVRLVTVDESHVAYNGVWVTTPEVSTAKASVHVEATVEGPVGKGVNFTIFDAKGRKVAFAKGVRTEESGVWSAELEISNPHFWDIEDCYQYCITTFVLGDKKIRDVYSQKFGVRTFDWDKEKGFFLNGRNVKLLGVCLHHDMGCLGTAVHKRALERELCILKNMGCNAIRTSHNPPAPELLQLCDEMGFLVIDEAMDMWRKRKTEFDYARFFDEWHARDVQDFVRRDRNHPCIFMWSIGNEILEQWNSDEDEAGEDNPNILLTKHMVALVKDLDPTRPVTSGCNETRTYNNLLRSDALDVYGFNYHTGDYDKLREWYPDKPLYGSETASSLNTRGFYPQPSTEILKEPQEWWMTYETPHHQCTAYDSMCAPWGDLHEHAWVTIRDRDFLAGTFVWTGFDYLGEPTPYGWPSRSSYFGIVDLAGFPKDIYYMYRSEWAPGKNVMHLFPHWNWKEGDKVDVWCYYSGADEVELFVNGKSVGRSRKEGEQLRAQWLSVPWESGCIKAVSYKDGKEVATDTQYTTGKPVGLRLTADRGVLTADGYDLSYVTVEALDADGHTVPDASDMLKFRVDGAGELVGVDNGNAAEGLCLKGDTMPLFAGKALAVVRSIRGKSGVTTLSVSSDYATIKLNITIK